MRLRCGARCRKVFKIKRKRSYLSGHKKRNKKKKEDEKRKSGKKRSTKHNSCLLIIAFEPNKLNKNVNMH